MKTWVEILLTCILISQAIPLPNPLEPERIYNPITAMGFLAMFTYQPDNTKG